MNPSPSSPPRAWPALASAGPFQPAIGPRDETVALEYAPDPAPVRRSVGPRRQEDRLEERAELGVPPYRAEHLDAEPLVRWSQLPLPVVRVT